MRGGGGGGGVSHYFQNEVILNKHLAEKYMTCNFLFEKHWWSAIILFKKGTIYLVEVM